MSLDRIIRTWVVLGVIGLPLVSLHAQEKFELSDEGFQKVAAPEPGTPEAELQAIRRAIAQEDGVTAQALADAWLLKHPYHASLPELYLLRGDAKAVQQQYFLALYDYEMVARTYPGSDQFEMALEREFKIAQAFARGLNRLLWGWRIASAEGEAEELLIRIQERAPGSPLAERAGIELADLYYRQGDMGLAAEAYELFLANYPRSQWQRHAMERQILANLAGFKGPRFDATGLVESRRRLIEYRQLYPATSERIGTGALQNRIDESLANRTLSVAQWYELTGKRVSAVFMYKRLMKEHPQSDSARVALERLKQLDPAFGQGPMPEGPLPQAVSP